MQNTDKEIVIIGGANGSGKTTFAKPFVNELGFEFLNADEIAKELQTTGTKNPLIKAGRIFFKRLEDCIDEGRNFVVETTLSGTYINKVAEKAKRNNYNLRIIYIFLDNPELCIDRVNARVVKGGHDVPVEDIVRRYYRSKNNFWNNFVNIADSWVLLYNGEEGFQQVAIGNRDEYSIENPILFKLFKSISK